MSNFKNLIFMALHTRRWFSNDFQGARGVDIFNRYVKSGDGLVLAKLLLNSSLIQQKLRSAHPLIIHDIGGADGEMMLALLRTLNLRARISVNEPNAERRFIYENKASLYPELFYEVKTSADKIEDKSYVLPTQREMVLASHVLYYNQANWLTAASIQDHLLTKLFQSVCVNGLMCVILQNSMLFQDRAHELWEDFVYPILEHTKHGENKFYACSSSFDLALSAYRKQFITETGDTPDWLIRAEVAKTAVPLGELNTTAGKDGKYAQTEETLAILNFYLKRYFFQDLSASMQRRILDVLLQHFTKESQCEIVHYNSIYTIELRAGFFSSLHKLKEKPFPTHKPIDLKPYLNL